MSTESHFLRVVFTPFALSVAAAAAQSKSTIVAGLPALDFAALRSGRTGIKPTASEEMYESHVV